MPGFLRGVMVVAVVVGCDPRDPAGAVTRLNVGVDPDAMAVADVDGDGSVDVVAVSGALRTITIVWGGAQAVTWSLAHEAAGVSVADFDGDGWLDVATAWPTEDAVAVLRGRGGRAFAEAQAIEVGAGPRAVVAAELDGGGGAELVAANLVDGTVTVIRGMLAQAPVVVGAGPRGLAAGDVDGDGNVDVAVALADDDAVQVLLGDGRGGLMPGPRHVVGAAPYAVVVAALDGEDGVEIATADALGQTVSVLHGNGAGGLRRRTTWPVVGTPSAMVAVQGVGLQSRLVVLSRDVSTVVEIDVASAASLRGVTTLDSKALAVGGGKRMIGAPGQVAVLQWQPGLQFAPLWTLPWASAVQLQDVDGDGVDEVLVAAGNDGRIAWWRDGREIGSVDAGLGAVFVGVAAGDVNGDGRRDLIAWHDNAVALAAGAAEGGFVAGGPAVRFEASVLEVALGDADGDGAAELLVLRDEMGGQVLGVYAGGADGRLTLVREIGEDKLPGGLVLLDAGGGPAVDLVGLAQLGFTISEDVGLGAVREVPANVWTVRSAYEFADVDGDGVTDMIACGIESVLLYRRALESRAEPQDPEVIGRGRCDRIAVHDVEGDGDLDVVVQANVWPDTRVWVKPWINSVGQFEERLGDAIDGLGYDEYVQLAHLDGDGVLDGAFRAASGEVRVMRGLAQTGLGEAKQRRFGTAASSLMIDVDGDGADDLVAVGDDLVVARGDGRGGFGPARRGSLGDATGVSAARMDLDGDGLDEAIALVRGVGTADIARIEIDAAGVPGRTALAPSSLMGRLLVGDVDGDRARDLVVSWAGVPLSDVYGAPGDGTLAHVVYAQTLGVWSDSVRLFDSDGDGRSELFAQVYTTSVDAKVGLWRWSWGDDGFGDGEMWLPDVDVTDMAVGDLNGDGVSEFALVMRGSLVVVSGHGVGVGPPWKRVLGGVDRVAVADVDGDGTRELLATGSTADTHSERTRLHVGRAVGGGWVFTDQVVPVLGQVQAIEVQDVDGDGAVEIVVSDGQGVTIVEVP